MLRQQTKHSEDQMSNCV